MLKEQEIEFEKEKIFKSLKFPNSNRPGRFDFYLPNQHCLIEFDGKQHFKCENHGWNTPEIFKELQQRDNYKNQWCKENNIPLIRIPYTHEKDLKIEDLLPETTNFLI